MYATSTHSFASIAVTVFLIATDDIRHSCRLLEHRPVWHSASKDHGNPILFWFCGLALFLVAGCVPTYLPLRADDSYPGEWPSIVALGPACEGVDGVYVNEGRATANDGSVQPLLLTAALGIRDPAARVSLDFQPDVAMFGGQAELTVSVFDGDSTESLLPCLCEAETLLCADVDEWALEPAGLGGSQQNVYLSMATDGSLIARLQGYSAGMIVVAPVYQRSDAWARFERSPP